MAPHKESLENKRSRQNLLRLLEATRKILDATLEAIRDRLTGLVQGSAEWLNVVYKDSLGRIESLEKTLRFGLSKRRAAALNQVGLLNETLKAKLELLWDCVREGAIQPILKSLNSILGSLAKALPLAHAVKECKEMMEVVIDRMGPETDPIVLKLELAKLE